MKHTTTKEPTKPPSLSHYTAPKCMSWQEWDKVPTKNKYISIKGAMYFTWTTKDGRKILNPIIII